MLPAIPVLEPAHLEPISIVRQAEKQEPAPYIVKTGDSLITIAERHSVSVELLWAANTQLTDPDIISVGEPLKIPQDSDVIAPRPPPAPAPAVYHAASNRIHSSSGNTYSPGYCTWFVKNVRPDIPNSWGDAWSWYAAAQGDGWPVGSVPQAGAIAWAREYGHVAIVTSVNGDTITVTEMNYSGWDVISSRSAPIGEFLYIY